jgi:protein TonB
LFLVVGLVGLKPPKVVHKPLREVAEVTPVVLTPQEEVPKTEPDVKPPEQEQPKETTDTPQVATVVAVENSSAVPFAVPVQGAVVVASEARLATPPPVAPRPTTPQYTQFNPSSDGVAGGSYALPSYPPQAERRGYVGTVTIHIHVDPSGTVTSADIFKSSGYTLLDDAAVDVVKHRWRFPQGAERFYAWPFTFQLVGR